MRQLSGSLSRRINVLADKTLLAAYAGQTHTLTPAHLDAAFNEGLEDMSYKIISFLKAHSQEAFEIEEIAEGVYGATKKQVTSGSAEVMARSMILEFPLAEFGEEEAG